MQFFDWEESDFLGGAFSAANAESIGQFDAANGYVGAICDVGEIATIVSAKSGVKNVIAYLATIGSNFLKGFPSGIFCFEFNNQGANGTSGQQAAEIENGLISKVGALAPFFDAEAGYASAASTITMANSYNAYSSSGIFGDLGYDAQGTWDCTTLKQLLTVIGGTGSATPQIYVQGNITDYTDCKLSGFLGLHAAITSLSGALDYQGAITAFKNAFGCPDYVVLSGGSQNKVNTSSLTCS